jgi:hypothetical protein
MCMEEQSHQKKSAKANQSNEREWPNPRNTSHANPRNVFGLDGENPEENLSPQGDPQTKPPACLVHHTRIKGAAAAAEVEGAAAEAEVAAGAKAIKRKENGITSSTRRTMITAQTIAQTRKDLKLSSRRKRRRRSELVL